MKLFGMTITRAAQESPIERAQPLSKDEAMSELGATGLQIQGGIVNEEFLRELKGSNGAKVYKQMGDNDAMIGALIMVWETMMRQTTVSVTPADVPENQQKQAQEVADFVASCIADMEQSWEHVISEAATMMQYGWSFLEQVYKVRGGRTEDPKTKSKYADGRIGWRKFAPRAQETLLRWQINDMDEATAMIQTSYMGQPKIIPLSKGLLFRTTTRKNNPEGRSMFRNAYRSWFRKTRLEDIEAIGVERDLAGYPVMYVPQKWLASSASTDEKTTVAALKQIVVNIRRDRLEGAVLPMMYDDKNNQLVKFELLASPSKRTFDTNAIIGRYNLDILVQALADFILLGHQKVGTQALSVDKTDMFSSALKAMLDEIYGVINKDAVPQLIQLNGMPLDLCPTLTYSEVRQIPIDKIIESLVKLSNAGAEVLSSEAILNQVLTQLDLPVTVTDGQ